MAWRAAWDRLTRPHRSVQKAADKRRARLAAALLLVLIPVAAVFVAVYALPDLSKDASWQDFISIAVFLIFLPAYLLVRGPRFRWGIVLLVAAPMVGLFVAAGPDEENVSLAYFSLVPVLLGGLLLDLRGAAALAGLDLGGTGLAAWRASAAFLDPFLFLLAGSAVVLLGAGFLERSIRDTESANQRLQDLDAYRLRLLHTVTHDLATPLTPMHLQIKLLEHDGQAKRAQVLRRNVDLMRRLVADISDLAKIESDRLGIQRHSTDVAELAQQAAAAIEGRAAERGVALHVTAAPAMAEADPERLTQVFYNLLSNACKFTPQGGSIRLDVRAGDPEVEVRVQDTGRGLEQEEIARLFQPFSQVHERSETTERGTGLGLYISKGIVEAHGGRIWVVSDGRGKGSVFGFSLPAIARAPL